MTTEQPQVGWLFHCSPNPNYNPRISDLSAFWRILRESRPTIENKQINAGKTPDGQDDQPNMKRQKDEDARWTKSHSG